MSQLTLNLQIKGFPSALSELVLVTLLPITKWLSKVRLPRPGNPLDTLHFSQDNPTLSGASLQCKAGESQQSARDRQLSSSKETLAQLHGICHLEERHFLKKFGTSLRGDPLETYLPRDPGNLLFLNQVSSVIVMSTYMLLRYGNFGT